MTTPQTSDAGTAGAPARSPVERAENALSRLGERVGGSAANVTRRIRRAGDATTEGPGRPAVDRAEAVVSRIEDTVSVYATVLGRRLRRIVARAREEADDVRAEAQHLRDERARDVSAPQHEQGGRAD